MTARVRDETFLPVAALFLSLAWVMLLMTAGGGRVLYLVPLLALAAGGTAVVCCRAAYGRPVAAALLLAFVLFALNLNFRQRELGATGLDWQNGLKLATWLALLAIGMVRWRLIARLVREPALGFLSAFAVIAVLSAVWSEVPLYTGASAAGLLAYLALACLVAADLDERSALRVMMWTLGAYVSLGLAGSVLLPDMTWLAPSVEETVYRLQGFSGHPNVFGQEIGLFITLTAIAFRQRLITRPVFGLLIVVGIVAILATGSRTTLAAVMTAWAVVSLRGTRAGLLALWIGAGAVCVLLMVAALGGLSDIGDLFGELSRTGRAGEIFTLTGRTEVWSVAWNLVLERPLLGWGFNGTEELLAGSMSSSFAGSAVNAHNMYLQSLLSLGFIGSIPVFALLGILVARFFTRPDDIRDQLLVFLLVSGLGEVEILATPIVLTLVVFWLIARDAVGAVHAARTRAPAHPLLPETLRTEPRL